MTFCDYIDTCLENTCACEIKGYSLTHMFLLNIKLNDQLHLGNELQPLIGTKCPWSKNYESRRMD